MSPDDVFEIGLNRAVTMLAEKKARGPGRRGAQTLKDLGADAAGTPIKVLKGKFGPYVSDGQTNATIPEGTEPESISLEQALAMIAERAAAGGKKKKKAAPKAKAPKAPAKKAAKKAAKPPAKAKTAAKKKSAKAAAKSKTPELAGE
jgi:DNA topoisomerase-1